MNKPKLCYKYADRSAKNSCEKAISDLGKMKQFDMNIGTTDNIIGGHRFVLAMFSKYFRDVTTTAPPHTMIFTRKFDFIRNCAKNIRYCGTYFLVFFFFSLNWLSIRYRVPIKIGFWIA